MVCVGSVERAILCVNNFYLRIKNIIFRRQKYKNTPQKELMPLKSTLYQKELMPDDLYYKKFLRVCILRTKYIFVYFIRIYYTPPYFFYSVLFTVYILLFVYLYTRFIFFFIFYHQLRHFHLLLIQHLVS